MAAYLENNKERRIIQSTQVGGGGGDAPEYNRRSMGSVESRRWREGHVELRPIQGSSHGWKKSRLENSSSHVSSLLSPLSHSHCPLAPILSDRTDSIYSILGHGPHIWLSPLELATQFSGTLGYSQGLVTPLLFFFFQRWCFFFFENTLKALKWLFLTGLWGQQLFPVLALEPSATHSNSGASLVFSLLLHSLFLCDTLLPFPLPSFCDATLCCRCLPILLSPSHHALALALPSCPPFVPLPSPSYRALALARPSCPRPHLPFPPSPSIMPSPSPLLSPPALTLALPSHPRFGMWSPLPSAQLHHRHWLASDIVYLYIVMSVNRN